jgi:hypothetical protein
MVIETQNMVSSHSGAEDLRLLGHYAIASGKQL